MQSSNESSPTEVERGDSASASQVGSANVQAAQKRSSLLLDAPATYLLLAINIVVFAIMLPHGPLPQLWAEHQFLASLTAPFGIDLLKHFGGCDGDLILQNHQWWRVLTAAFVHVSVLHLLVNMWCLWNLGLLGEPLLGRQGLIATYLLTGAAGNLCSLAFRQDELVVGASGAVFGVAGILIVLLSNRRLSLPWKDLRSLRRSVVQFAVLNLVIGLAPQVLVQMIPRATLSKVPVDLSPLTQIDNTAHLGGLISGLAMGLPLFPRMMSGRAGYRARQRVTFITVAVGMALLAYFVSALRGR